MAKNVSGKKWYSWYFDFNLLYRILIGLVVGIILGLIFKEKILWIQPFGDLFVRLLKMIMMPIILSTLIVGASSVSPANLGKIGLRIIIVYLVTSALAVVIGLAMGALYHPQAIVAQLATDAAAKPVAAQKMSQVLLNIVPTSVAQVVVNETILPVIFFALVFGIGVSYLRVSDNERIKTAGTLIYNICEGIAEVMMRIVHGIMQYAPFGVLALCAVVFAQNGPKVIGALGVVTAAAFSGYILHIVLVYGGLVKIAGLKLGRFIHDAKNPAFTGFVTRSSNGTLPVNMEAAENLGVPKSTYSFTLPLGATVNMDGTAIYLGVCVTFIALTVWGHSFDMAQYGTIIITATLASIGTAGVPGAGPIMMLMVLEQVGLPVTEGSVVAGAYAMILGIDALLDMGRTCLNVTGDLTCTTVVSKWMKQLDMSKWEKKTG